MNNNYKKITADQIDGNVFKTIGDEWMLITAGNIHSYNTMTANWGFMGLLWHKHIAVCFIRPQRFTLGFVEKNAYYTLSFFDEKYKNILDFCGSNSGRNINKAKETGLIPISTELNNVSFEQARMILECKKLYADSIYEDNFIDKELISNYYSAKDFHRFFFGEIINVYLKTEQI